MRIAVIGAGYVGLVTGTCFSEMGNQVICVDKDLTKLDQLRLGQIPFHEPGLDQLVRDNSEAGRLTFKSDIETAIEDVELVFIAVGTPAQHDGKADISFILQAAQQIGQAIQEPLIVVNKSTVPVGTADRVRSTIEQTLKDRQKAIDFDVISNPEFLREGSAVKDFMFPDRIVIGTDSDRSRRAMEDLYAPFAKKEPRLHFVGVRDAEMIKYAANAMLATKISFMNEVALMCEKLDIDIEKIRLGIGSDPRIGPEFIYPGCGYGGSCFPKDVKAMIAMADEVGVKGDIFKAVENRNKSQKILLVNRLREYLGGSFKDRTIAVWGLAFKPDTDDIREAPAIAMIELLLNEGARINCYDPKALANARNHLGTENISYLDDPYAATENSDVLIVATEWRQFKQPDFRTLAKQLKTKCILDGRNIYNPKRVTDYGLDYIGIGRSRLIQ